MSTLQISNTEDRDDLYYGLYQYQARFWLSEASCLRELDHDKIDKVIAWRHTWLQYRRVSISQGAIEDLHTVCGQLQALENPYKKVIYQNYIYIYTNSTEDIAALGAGPLNLRSTTRVNITHPKDTVGLQNPRHKFRTYVRSHKPTPEQCENLALFISAAGTDVRPSPGLKEFLGPKNRRYWMSDYYFIDHNEMSMVTALALMNPKLVRKTMPIVKVNN